MSKSSTASSHKPLLAQSAWAKGPPQTSSAPSPRSQSPAPPTTSQPHLTHSRRPSALGQAIPIKDGVSIPRNNAGAAAAKHGSAVTFGSIDDASASISSSPAAAPPLKSEGVVKSFGSVPAGPTSTPSSNTNGKPSTSSRPAVSTSTAPTIAPSLSSSTAATSTTTSSAHAKLDKRDIAKLFQSSSSPAAGPSETQSPSLRAAPLPSQPQQSQSQASSSSQPSQFGSHFTPFVPSGRPPQQGAGPSNGPSRSPVYQRQMQNGTGPRSQGPPNGVPSTGLSSPRLAPPHVAQQQGVPPSTPQVPGQPPMPGPQMMWANPYYYPAEYMQYNPSWGYMPQQMPPQSAHPHPQHMPQGPPHMPPHSGMPMSPHNPPRNLQGPGTPTLSHAAPNPVHPPHPPPPLPHAPTNISSISSPPPTPSTAISGAGRLSASSSTFVPQHRPASKITLKNPEGKEVALESLTKSNAAASSTNNAATAPSGQSSPYRQSSPGTPKRLSIRIESEEQRKKRLAEEEEREKEKQKVQQEAEDKARRQKEEAQRKVKEEEQRQQKEIEQKERERKRREEEDQEKERLRQEEEARKQRETEERLRKEEEQEKERIRKEEEQAKRQAEEQAKEEEEEKERLRKEEEQRRLKEEEEARQEQERRKQQEADQRRREAEERRQQVEAEKEAQAGRGSAAPSAPEEGEVQEAGTISKEELKERVKEALRIDTSTSNPADLGKRRPAQLDLSGTKVAQVASSLSTARHIENINVIRYPEGISSPRPELNENAKPGQFRYDRDFLLQFMSVCKEKPPNLPPLDAIGLEPIDQAALMISRGGSGRHRNTSSVAPSRQASIGLPFGGPGSFGKSGSSNFPMGNFATTGKLSSEDRFAMSNAANRSTSVNAASGLPFGGRPAAMQRTASQGGQIRERTRSKRGEKRPTADGGKPSGGQQDRGPSNYQHTQLMNLEPVAPLQASANRWDRKALAAESDSPELVDRKVKGLLNKLTMEKFDSISDQIIAWANKSEKEKDGRTLIQVIRLVFEKATDEATWSEMYARLCRKMMEQISGQVQDDGIKNAEGKPIAGGQLFRKYLLNRCQEDFERGWVAKEATAAAAASKAAEDEAVKAANSQLKEGTDEVALYSDEYYAAQKAKRQGLGLIKFIGELFKLQMLTERIMHECVKKLLGNVENPEEEEIESLCKLLSTVGALLDTAKAHAHMDIYFSRMKELTKSPNVSSRMQFMLQDLLELRDRKWVSRNAIAAPTTLAQVHENAAKEKAAQEKDAYQRQIGMSRTSSNRGRGRNDFDQTTPDGWAVAGSGAPRPPPKAGDLSNFGKISKTQTMTMTFGPSSVFSAKGKVADKRESISRSSSSSNMFSMLSQTADSTNDSKPELPQRRKLVLQPRSVPKENDAASPAAPAAAEVESSEEEGETAVPEISEKDAMKKIDEDIKELFAVRNLDEAEVYFTGLPPAFHHKLVDKIVTKAIESKAADAELVASFFERASSKGLCGESVFEEGFNPVAEVIDDIALDAPLAFRLFAKMAKGAGFGEAARQRLASKSVDNSDELLTLLS